MVAAMAYIPDVSSNPEYANYWRDASMAEKKRIVDEAGYSRSNYKSRAWFAISAAVRRDLVTIIQRHQKAAAGTTSTLPAKPRSVPNPNHWYNRD